MTDKQVADLLELLETISGNLEGICEALGDIVAVVDRVVQPSSGDPPWSHLRVLDMGRE